MNRLTFFVRICACSGLLLLVASCSPEKKGIEWKEQDLMQYGVPIEILAPDSIEVEVRNYASQKDITVKGPGDYRLQIFESARTSVDPELIVAEWKDNIKENRYFDSIVKEFEDGFIYKLVVDTTHVSYGFRRVKIQGSKEYLFQNYLLGEDHLEDAEKMYFSFQ